MGDISGGKMRDPKGERKEGIIERSKDRGDT